MLRIENKSTNIKPDKNMDLLIPVNHSLHDPDDINFDMNRYQGSVVNKKGLILSGCIFYLNSLNALWGRPGLDGVDKNKFIEISKPDYYLDEDNVIVPIFEPWKFYKFGGKILRYIYFSDDHNYLQHKIDLWYPLGCPERPC